MNTCAPFQELLSDYFDGRMGSDDPATIGLEAHLAGCPACAGMLRDFSLLREAVRPEGASVADPAAFARGLYLRIKVLRIRAGSRPTWWRPAAMAAGIVLAVGGGWALHAVRPFPSSPPPPVHIHTPPGRAAEAPPGWTLVGEAGPATLNEMAETQDLSDLVEDLHLIRGGRTDRETLYREIASVQDLAMNGPILREVSYAP